MFHLPLYLCNDDSGQDIAEYAVMDSSGWQQCK